MGLNPQSGQQFVSVYIDDILIFSRTLQEHIQHIELVLRRIIESGLKLMPSKCFFLRQEVEYLGHIITSEGLKVNPVKVAAVENFPAPTSVSQVRQFLGLVSYYRRFIVGFANIAQPLHALTKKEVKFKWSPECQAAFDSLKSKLIVAPILTYPNFDLDFIVETDASVKGLGAILSQRQNGNLLPIAYASRALTQSEKNYCITDLETLAIVWSLSHFRAYL